MTITLPGLEPYTADEAHPELVPPLRCDLAHGPACEFDASPAPTAGDPRPPAQAGPLALGSTDRPDRERANLPEKDPHEARRLYLRSRLSPR